MDNKGIYSEEEQRRLDIIANTRFDVITNMTKGGVPEKIGEIRVLNEVLNSADKAIVDTAVTRIKHSEAATNGAMASTVVALLKQAHANRQKVIGENGHSDELPVIDAKLQDVEVVAGETEIDPTRLIPEDFVPPAFDATNINE